MNMKKVCKISLSVLCACIVAAVAALCVLLLLGFRFSEEQAVHSFWREGTRIEAGEYAFWLDDAVNAQGAPVYGMGHQGVKKYGFLYKRTDRNGYKTVTDEYGDYVASLTRYEGEETNYYFIHWMQSVTGIEDGKYTTSMRYFTDKIEINGSEIALLYHCFFAFDGEIETLMIKERAVTVKDVYEKPPVSVYAPKTEDTSLAFWITENMENADLSRYEEIVGWMGAREFYGEGYASVVNEDGSKSKPAHYVTYLITAYPDYADGGSYVTRIEITDPAVTVYGLTVNSSVEEFDALFRRMGYIVSVEEQNGARVFTAKKHNHITFIFSEGSENAAPFLTVTAAVSNRENIQY